MQPDGSGCWYCQSYPRRSGDFPFRPQHHLLAGPCCCRPIREARSGSIRVLFSGRTHERLCLGDSASAGGGPIIDTGVHCVDALCFVLDDEIDTVGASTTSDRLSGDVEAAAILSLSFARGTLGSVLVSTRAEYRTPLEIVGEEGVLHADNAFSVSDPVEIELRTGGKVVEREVVSNTDVFWLSVKWRSGVLR